MLNHIHSTLQCENVWSP
jgi:hypothetical protein